MKIHLALILILLSAGAGAQNSSKKEMSAIRTNQAMQTDGILNEEIWSLAMEATDFSALSPFNHPGSEQKTTVKIVYDDQALYVAAIVYDPFPDSIVKEFTSRDDLGTSDFFGVYFDTYNDGLNAYGFFVNVAGIQCDSKISATGNEDDDWDAVWDSRTVVSNQGWILEMRIPYSALRFPKAEKSVWGINFFRLKGRTRQKDSWSFIDRKKGPTLTQMGQLTGIENITPPLRLAFLPYLAVNCENKGAKLDPAFSFKGGLDVKYGISENFTLDMMLIPDFGQVQSDKKSYNFTPYEQYFEEKRPFFTEGTEIFSKGDIFYSRRIGSILKKYKDAEVFLLTNEEVEEEPQSVQLLNSTKLSGKTRKGFSIGVLNAITDRGESIFRDTLTGKTRKVVTQSMLNYNLLVLDKSLKNNSYLAFSNANVLSGSRSYFSNVSSSELRLTDTESKYALTGLATMSHISDTGVSAISGFRYNVGLEKTSGNFRFSLSQNLETDKFNPNDLGYLQSPNEIANVFTLEYNVYEPFWRMLYAYNSLEIGHSSQYKPRRFHEIYFNFNHNSTFKNQLTVGSNLYVSPVKSHDYHESRTGRMYEVPAHASGNIWFSPDYRKTFIVDFSIGGWKAFMVDRKGYSGNFSPRWKINRHFIVVYEYNFSKDINEQGYYKKINSDSIAFGNSTKTYISQSLEADFVLNNRHSFELEVYHNWTRAKYHSFGLLNGDGKVDSYPQFVGKDLNYNAFNVDLLYRWEFSPGSELLVVLKNNIESEQSKLYSRYSGNFNQMFSNDQINRVSVKVLYYIDYQNLIKRKRKKV